MLVTQRPPDIEAEITFLSTADSGRQTYVLSGYRPSHNFGIPGMLNDAVHEYIGPGKVEPGESALANIWLLTPEYQEGRLYPGFTFTVQEGSRVVGHGVIRRIPNESLQSQHRT
jgi:translation elongation factor EF-Tu-like GTPase